jgi:uncharacterized protein YprB with RNaseH-like and TPR domain
VLSRLDLVWGVGQATASRLRQAGMTTVEDLLHLFEYRDRAAEVIAEWDLGRLPSLCTRLTRRLGGVGHLLSALVCSQVELERVVFFDLETLGLWNNPIFLAGVGRFRDGAFEVNQFLAPGYAHEPGVLARASAELEGAQVVVTFNGRTADMPWLVNRVFYHGLPAVPELAHVDLIHGVRRRFRIDEDFLPDARLPTVQRHLLAHDRPVFDVPSWLIPTLYQEYAKRGARSEGLLVPVVDHNCSDLEALAVLLEVLCREAGRWN